MVLLVRAAVLAALAALLAACGGQTASDPGYDGVRTDKGGGMSMGDPNAVPADQVPGAELVSGRFGLLDTAPEGYQDVAGTAELARHDGGTTVTIELRGLQPNSRLISHVHQGRCSEGGGAHYKFDRPAVICRPTRSIWRSSPPPRAPGS